MQSNLNVVIGVFKSKSGKDTEEKSHRDTLDSWGTVVLAPVAFWEVGHQGLKGSSIIQPTV